MLRSESLETNATIADHNGICGFYSNQGIALDIVVQLVRVALILAL